MVSVAHNELEWTLGEWLYVSCVWSSMNVNIKFTDSYMIVTVISGPCCLIQIQNNLFSLDMFITQHTYIPRADSRFAPSQWETALLCNDFSHWLGANLESALIPLHRYTIQYRRPGTHLTNHIALKAQMTYDSAVLQFNHWIATQICICHNNSALIEYTKFGSNNCQDKSKKIMFPLSFDYEW